MKFGRTFFLPLLKIKTMYKHTEQFRRLRQWVINSSDVKNKDEILRAISITEGIADEIQEEIEKARNRILHG